VSNSYRNRLKIFEQHHDVASNDGSQVSEDLEGSQVESHIETNVAAVIMDKSPTHTKQADYNFEHSPKQTKAELYNFGEKPSVPDLPQNALEDSLEETE